jgi:hypothetical protein
MTAERVYLYWDTPGRAPAPGETVTLDDGRLAVVETAHASSGAIEKRKLVVRLTPDGDAG